MSTDAAPEPPPAKVPPHMWRKVQSEREQRIIDATAALQRVLLARWRPIPLGSPRQ